MKKLLAATAAAALLCTGGVALAKKPKPVIVTVSLLGQTCSINVLQQNDTANNVTNYEYFVANSKVPSHNCSFNGQGLLGKATFKNGRSSDSQNLAIISGYSPLLSQFAGVNEVTVTLTYPLVSGGTYTAYYYNSNSNGNATSIARIVSGTYTTQ